MLRGQASAVACHLSIAEADCCNCVVEVSATLAQVEFAFGTAEVLGPDSGKSWDMCSKHTH